LETKASSLHQYRLKARSGTSMEVKSEVDKLDSMIYGDLEDEDDDLDTIKDDESAAPSQSVEVEDDDETILRLIDKQKSEVLYALSPMPETAKEWAAGVKLIQRVQSELGAIRPSGALREEVFQFQEFLTQQLEKIELK
jgi:hypothetical protein